MAVTLPSDLIMDVMRNADPARRTQAVAKLEAAGPADSPRFAGVLQGLDSAAPPKTTEGGVFAASATRSHGKAGTYQGFERMVLRNLFETLLPDEQSGAFGGGPSAGVWRSMAADQFAGVYADAGGIGIARMLEQKGAPAATERQEEWPYFSLPKLGSVEG